MDPKSALAYYQFLQSQASPWEEQINELAKYIAPQRYNGKRTLTVLQDAQPEFGIYGDIYDPIGQESAMDLATMLMSWTTPDTGGWLNARAPIGVRETDSLKKRLDALGELAGEMIAASNYYEEEFAIKQDLSFGTVCKYREFRPDTLSFHFRAVPSFVCAMGKDGVIDTVFSPAVYTARQAVEEFGYDRIPEKIRKQADDPRKWHETSEYIHFAMPNPKRKPGSRFQEEMPWLVGWIHKDTGTYVKDRFGMDTTGGAMDSPYLVGGFLPSSRRSPNAPYYTSPAFAALPDMRQLQHIVKAIDGRIEMEYAPPVGIPSSMPGGTVGLRPYDHFRLGDDNQMPQAFVVQGRGIDAALMRAQELRESISRKFMRHVFKMFDGLDPAKMTATEVQARMSEKQDFLPIFGLVLHNYQQEDGQWIFSKIIESRLWEVPRELRLPDGGILVPRVRFSNRLTQLLEISRATSSMKAVAEAAQMAQLTGDPSALDRFDQDKIALENYRAQNGLADGIKDNYRVQRERAQRAQFAAAQMEAAAAAGQAA